MKAAIPALCIISAMLSTVSTLQCTHCDIINSMDKDSYYNINVEKSPKKHCDGPAFTCSSEDELCATVYVSSTKYNNNNKEAYLKRSCLNMQNCNISESISTPGFSLSYGITCCNTDECTPVLPVVKAANTTKNGVWCQACYSESQECEAKYSMQCTGEEKHCLTYHKTSPFNVNPIYSSGCSTKNACIKDINFLHKPKSMETIHCNKVKNNPDKKPGHFLWCNTCHSYNVDDCNVQSYLCSPDEDVCVFEKTRNIFDGRDEVEITKRCGKSNECNRVGSIRSSTKTILINTSCCDRNMCNLPLLTLPSTNNDTNGVICPACFVPNSDRCLGHGDIKCTGNEKRCIHYMRTEKQDIYTVTESLHGCTTDEICVSGSSLALPNNQFYKTVKTDIICSSAITHLSEIYTFLMITVTALSVRKF